MSLILDALRKSEAERRRGEAPGLFTALPTPGARISRPAPRWPWLAAAAVVVIALLAWRFWPSAPVEVVAIPVKPVPAPVAAAPAAPVAETTPAPEKVAPAPKAPPPELESAPEPKAMAALPLPPPPPPADATPKPDDPPLEALPTLAALGADERAALPPLKLSMHVWSEAPNARLAIIDGQRVMEGSAIGESIVAEIRRDGVVLAIHGRRYLLPRP